MILAVGEALMEFRRDTADGRLATPGTWAGPFPSGAPAIFAGAADFDLELLENRTLDGHTQELIYRPVLH